MSEPHGEFLNLLGELTDTLDQLAGLSRRKVDCTKQGDLEELDACMKREQVITLALKTLEKRREALLNELSLEGVPLSRVYEHYPSELQLQAREAVEALQHQFTRYQSGAAAARNAMERALRDIEKMMPPDAPPPQDGPPKKLRTDLRA